MVTITEIASNTHQPHHNVNTILLILTPIYLSQIYPKHNSQTLHVSTPSTLVTRLDPLQVYFEDFPSWTAYWVLKKDRFPETRVRTSHFFHLKEEEQGRKMFWLCDNIVKFVRQERRTRQENVLQNQNNILKNQIKTNQLKKIYIKKQYAKFMIYRS